MIKTKEIELYNQVWNTFGETAQICMLMEECGELIQASNKYLRYKNLNYIIQEIADVEIMIDQMKSQLKIGKDVELIKQKQHEKLERYIKRGKQNDK